VRYRLTGAGLSPAGSRQLRLTHRNWKFESISLQQRVDCEPDSLDQGGEIASLPDSLPLDWAGAQNNLGNALAAFPLSRRLGGATGSLIGACMSCATESTVRLRSNCSEI
jgi:hypothetical protein